MSEPASLTFRTFWWRVVAAHMVTYVVAGLVASTVFDYGTLYAQTELRHLMRPTTTAWVAAGPALQVIRGTLFALVLWPIADRLVASARGAWILYGLMLGLAVLGTAGPTPGSLEGLFFTTLPVSIHAIALPEVIVQTGAFSFLLVLWCRRPARWMNVVAVVSIVLTVIMSALGVAAAVGVITPP
jgi:hypothetical protein